MYVANEKAAKLHAQLHTHDICNYFKHCSPTTHWTTMDKNYFAITLTSNFSYCESKFLCIAELVITCKAKCLILFLHLLHLLQPRSSWVAQWRSSKATWTKVSKNSFSCDQSLLEQTPINSLQFTNKPQEHRSSKHINSFILPISLIGFELLIDLIWQSLDSGCPCI